MAELSSALGAILFFFIVLGVIGVTIWLVIREFKRVHNHIDVTEETYAGLGTSFSNLRSNVQSNYLLRGDFATASNNILAYASSIDKRLGAQSNVLGQVSASNKSVADGWNTYFTTSNNQPLFKAENIMATNGILAKGIVSEAMLLGNEKTFHERPIPPYITYDEDYSVTMSNLGGKYDLNVPRTNIGQSLNIAGKLNFATANSSYMLGVDGASMYLKMADEQAAKFQLRDPSNTSILTIDRTGAAADVTMTGCIKNSTPGSTASLCLNKDDTISLSGAKVQIPQASQLSIGSYTLKEDSSGQLVVQKGTTDVMVLSPSEQSKVTFRNSAGGSHTLLTAGSSNLTLVA